MSKNRKGSLRDVNRFDYCVYDDSGDKVPLGSFPFPPEVSNMEQDLASEEKLRKKIKRYIAENDIDLLFDISDLEEAISGIDQLVSSFEDVHVTLRRQLKDQYVVSCPNFDDQISDVTEWIKKAKLAIKEKKQATFAAKGDPVAQCKSRLTTEEKFLFAKIDEEITTFIDEDSFFISDIEKNISSIEDLSKVTPVCSSKSMNWVLTFSINLVIVSLNRVKK